MHLRYAGQTVIAGITAVFLILATSAAFCQGNEKNHQYILGPVQEVALIEDFIADRASKWKPRSGSNVSYTVRSGAELPGVASTLMAIQVGARDPNDGDPAHNWFAISRDDLPAGTVPEDIDGFRFMLGSHREVQWWISVGLVAESSESFSHVIADHSFPAGRIVEYTVPLEAFKSRAGKALTGAEACALRGISFTISNQRTTLYLDKIAAYRREKLSSWLDFTTSHPVNNLFQRTDPVKITFTIGGIPPKAARGFRYEIRDFFNRLTARGIVRLTDARAYTVPATPETHGYYEVRAFFTDGSGRDIENRSRIRAEGTVPAGLGTFSVLPTTIEENIARFRKLGKSAFFGLHGDFHGLADHAGLAWRFDYLKWPWIEPQKPDRSSGMAPWALDLMKNPPEPDYRLHILPFRGNMGEEVPVWAKSKTAKAPPFENWGDYLAMVRDYVKVEKHLYPHMKPRIYGGAWEVNLNMPPYISQPPEHTPRDVVELFRRTREAVKAEDPDGILIGPCPSVLHPQWFETIFKAGVLDYLDGIETHGYLEGVYNPEENDFPGKIARLKELMRKYNKGRTLPIYCTEAGQPGILGSAIVHRSQAQRMVRTAIILKGEGAQVFLPFYGIDYDRAGYWGFFFNLDVDAPSGPWATRRVSPKPMVNAMAACIRALEGTKPKARLRTLGKDVWAYVFEKQDATIIAVWTTGRAATVRLPVGRARSVEVVNIMGHSRQLPVTQGVLRLAIDGSPVYVIDYRKRRQE